MSKPIQSLLKSVKFSICKFILQHSEQLQKKNEDKGGEKKCRGEKKGEEKGEEERWGQKEGRRKENGGELTSVMGMVRCPYPLGWLEVNDAIEPERPEC